MTSLSTRVAVALALAAVPAFGQQASPAAPPTTAPSVEPAPVQSAVEPAPVAPPTGAATPASTAPEVPAPIEPPVPAAPTGTPAATTAPGVSDVSSLASAGPAVHDFQGDEIGTVLRLLARQAKVPMVVSDKVQGTVTLRIEGRSALDVIKIICTSKNLSLDEIDGVYYVKTAEERQAEPREPGNYTFSYAKATTIAPLLQKQLRSGVAPDVDERTNTIFYSEVRSNLEGIKDFLRMIDKPTQQVMIEARLVEVNANPKQSYGINWSGVVGGAASPKTVRFAGSNPAGIPTTQVVDGQVVTIPSTPPTFTFDETSGQLKSRDFFRNGELGPNFFDQLGGQFAILSVPQMSLTYRLLNEDQDAEFLANPRIVTANNQSAKIKITRNQPVPQLNFNEQTATAVFGGFEDKEFGNTLQVTPSINKDDFVTLGVKPEISNKVGDATFTFAGATVASPIIDKRELESNVLIKSGDTLAIGGLLQDEVTKARTKVPILGDIPVVGYAFQERLNSRTKRNLLVFVTPTIIKQGYGTGLEDQVSGLKYSGDEYADPNGWRNNARGAVRVVPTSNRQVAADYPKPGTAVQPNTVTKYKAGAPAREQ